MRKRFCSAIPLLTLCLLVHTSCLSAQTGENVSEQKNFIKIGGLVCQSGACALDGSETLQGAQMAIEEINSGGGVLGRPLKLVLEDTDEAVTAQKAISAYRRLRLDPAIKLFIGPSWTPASQALAPIVARDQGVMMATPSSGAEEFHRAGGNLFNVRGTDQQASRLLARYVRQQGHVNIAIFSSQQSWELAQGLFVEDEFKRLGGTIAIKVEPLPTLTNLHTEALKITAKKPDAVIFTNYNQLALAARSLKELNYTGPRFSVTSDPLQVAEAQGGLEGAVVTMLYAPAPAFSAMYRKKYGSDPKLSAPIAFDTVKAYALAISRAQSTEPGKVRLAFAQLDFPGASGRIRFDEASGRSLWEGLKALRCSPWSKLSYA